MDVYSLALHDALMLEVRRRGAPRRRRILLCLAGLLLVVAASGIAFVVGGALHSS